MIKQYEGNETWKITLTSGKEITLTEDELSEIGEKNYDELLDLYAQQKKFYENKLEKISEILSES